MLSILQWNSTKILMFTSSESSTTSQSNALNITWIWFIIVLLNMAIKLVKTGTVENYKSFGTIQPLLRWHENAKSLILTRLICNTDWHNLTLCYHTSSLCASVTHALPRHCQLNATLQHTTTLCFKFNALCSHAVDAWKDGFLAVKKTLCVSFCRLPQQGIVDWMSHTHATSHTQLNTSKQNCSY